MDLHGSINLKIPEAGLSYFIYEAYSNEGFSYKLDLGKLTTNCNQYLLEVYDKSPTRGQVTCIPINLLKKLVESDNSETLETLETKTELFEKVSKTYSYEQLYKKYYIFYKPIFTKPIVTKYGWEEIPNNNVLENTTSNSIPNISNSNRDLWLSNKNLASLMKTYTIIKPKTNYIGVLYLSCFDNIEKNDMDRIYSMSALKTQIELLIKPDSKIETNSTNSKKYNHILGHIVSYSHWSSLVIDKTKKHVYHYCSGGNNPKHYPNLPDLIFYSTSKSFKRGEREKSKIPTRVVSKFVMFEHLMNNGYKVFLNVEGSQMLSGECGMFASIFLILYTLNNIDTTHNIKALYNSFSFMGDKMMGLYKELLFWRESFLPLHTIDISYDRAKEWKILLSSQANRSNAIQEKLLNEMNAVNKELRSE